MALFQEKGFEVHAIGSNSMGRKDELIELGIICHDIEFDKTPFSSKNRSTIKELNWLFENIYFDLIHVHTPIAAFITRYVASKKKQGKILYTAHGFHFFAGAPVKNWLFYYTAEKIAVKWTDGLVVMNKEDFQLAKKLGYQENENVFKVHGVGVDLSEFKTNAVSEEVDIRQELDLDKDTLIISCIAELSARKNHEFLLQNWKAIIEKYPNVHVVFAGNGKAENKINTIIEQQGLKNVHVLGFRGDVPKLIASSDIVTLLSKHEGLPRCLMEAMACGKTIITSNVRGSTDLVEHGKSGMTVELNDNENLVKSFIKLLGNEQMRIDFGKQGQRKIQDYSLKNVLHEMDTIYSRYLT